MKKHELDAQLSAIKRYAQNIQSVTLNPSDIVVVKYHAKTEPKTLKTVFAGLTDYLRPLKVIFVPDKINVGVLPKKVFQLYWYKVKNEVGI